MNSPHRPRNKTFRLKPETIQFIDSFAETYGVSKNAVVNLAILDMKKTLDAVTADDPHKGAVAAMAFGMQAEKLDH
jgi:hypothetical protein